MQKDLMILSINGGSSSIKFACYQFHKDPKALLSGAIENIGSSASRFQFTDHTDERKHIFTIGAADHEQAAHILLGKFSNLIDFKKVGVIGHRIVHGMDHTAPEVITPDLLKELNQISTFDPEHLPAEIKLIEIFRKKYPHIKQIACFDTSFHTSMPLRAKLLALPRKYYDKGIKRYGFHGLSYAYLLQELERIAGSAVAKGKVLLAHLGNGASIAAVKDGKSIDTSMGFTPTAGLPMSSRTGDLDPGVAAHIMQKEKLNVQAFTHLINHESGLLGISETHADMQELLKIEITDSNAKEAIEYFCYQTRKWIGAYAAALGGLQTLVFSGGIGENAPTVRFEICKELQFLGIEIDKGKNEENDLIISTTKSKVIVFVIKTNEEIMIANLASNFLD